MEFQQRVQGATKRPTEPRAERRARAEHRPRTEHRARAAAAAALGVLALATACTSHKSHAPTSAAPNPAEDLAAVAQIARTASYTATYTADSSENPPRSTTIKVFRTATRARLDLAEPGSNVRIQVDPTGTYTCKVPTTGRPSCLTLAGPGQLPKLDPSGQALFTTTLDVLAAGTGLTVATAPPRPGVNQIPASTCFALIAAPAGDAAPGTYCFSADGVLTRAQFRSNVLQLTSLAGAPADADFTLPATPLPLGSPSPSGASATSPSPNLAAPTATPGP